MTRSFRKCMLHSLSTLLFLPIAFPAVGESAPEKPQRTQATSQSGQRLPLSPLTSEEQRAAEQVAVSDARVRELLGTGRLQLVSVDLFVEKPPAEQIEAVKAGRRPAMDRFAEVVFFRYEGSYGVRAVVDLERRTVITAARLESRQVPMTPADLTEAWKIAMRNEEVQRLLGPNLQKFRPAAATTGKPNGQRYVVEGLRVQGVDEKDPCFNHRCLYLLFRQGDAYLIGPAVFVDLTAENVSVEGSQK